MRLESEKSILSVKHVNIRFNFSCHHVRERIFVTRFVNSQDMMADMLTKELPASRMEELQEIQGEVHIGRRNVSNYHV